MSFQTDINTILKADASLNSLVDHIFPKRSVGEIDEENDSLMVFDYSKEDSYNTRSTMDAISQWRLYIYVGSKNAMEMFNIEIII